MRENLCNHFKEMTELEALISLNCADIGFRRYLGLLEYFDSAEGILQASPGKLIKIDGIGEKTISNISSIKAKGPAKELKAVKRLGLKVVTINDSGYPELLKEIYDPPLVLYVKGNLDKVCKFNIAIVGSRNASFYGLSYAEKFARELSDLGFTIVSGMARGVDTAAHKGALKAGGHTIAVMGSGFENIYPPENKGLASEIAQDGAVISEFPVYAEALPANFPRRNRIISGLSQGVLVVEAARNSGALITADFALEQGREVFSLPGKIDSQNSSGTNYLIKQGAKLVSCVEDIVEELGFELKTQDVGPIKKEQGPEINLVKEQKVLFDGLLSKEPMTLDEICGISGLSAQQAMSKLLELEIKGAVRQLPGKRFLRGE